MARNRGFVDLYAGGSEDNVPLGVRLGDLLYVRSLEPISRSGSTAGAVDIRLQTREVLEQMQAMLEGAGGSTANVGRAVGYMQSAGDQREAMYDVWEELFPDPSDKPAFKALNADLPEGMLLRIDFVALIGQRRRRVDIPGVDARDPTVRIGDMVFTSRLHGTSPATGQAVEGLRAQSRQAVENGIRLVELAGGSKTDVTQITAFGRDLDYLPELREAVESQFGDEAPSLNALITFIRPQLEVMVEMTACTSSSLPG